jgi:hypothetical protein
VHRFLARHLVDLAIAVVVLRISANLYVAGIYGRVGIVAVAGGVAVPVGHSVAVGVAKPVLAALRFFDAAVDGASLVVVAVDDRSSPAAELGIAPLDSVAENAVLTARIIGDELTAAKAEVTRIVRAIETIVALAIVGASLTESRAIAQSDVGCAGVGRPIGRGTGVLDERARRVVTRATRKRQERDEPERWKETEHGA